MSVVVSTFTLGVFLAEAGALLTAMLLARSYALRHVPACYLPTWVRARELRRDDFCRLAVRPAIGVTLIGMLLILVG